LDDKWGRARVNVKATYITVALIFLDRSLCCTLAAWAKRNLEHKFGRPDCLRNWTGEAAYLEEVQPGLVAFE
jgi:hypothetical protein